MTEELKQLLAEAVDRIKQYERQVCLDLQKMAELQAELLAKEEQLAAMREALEAIIKYSQSDLVVKYHSIGQLWEVGDMAKDALSAAPGEDRMIICGDCKEIMAGMKSSEKTLRVAAAYYRQYHNEGDKALCACTICRMVDGVSEQTDLERLGE